MVIPISTDFTLFDRTWFTAAVNEPSTNNNLPPPDIAEERRLPPPNIEEERRLGVSTSLTLYSDSWKIKKRLTQSDLNNLSRLLIGGDLVRTHILPLMNEAMIEAVKSKKGLRVLVKDLDTGSELHLTFKLWSSSRCYVFNDNWNKSFVGRRSLKLGDEIGLCWDPYNCRFNFCVFRRA